MLKPVKLIDLVGKNVAGIRANVIRQGGKYHYDYQDRPMVRTLESVKYKKEAGKQWIYWTWTPEQLEDGRLDCGYSGISDSEYHHIDEAFILIEGVSHA